MKYRTTIPAHLEAPTDHAPREPMGRALFDFAIATLLAVASLGGMILAAYLEGCAP